MNISESELPDVRYTVGNDEDVIITAEFRTYKASIPDNVTVKKYYSITAPPFEVLDEINESTTLYHGNRLVITAEERPGYIIKSLTVNGTEISNGSTYKVGYEDVIIKVTYEKTSGDCRLHILSSGLMVFRDNVQLTDGSTVQRGDVLAVTASAVPSDGSELILKINGTEAARLGNDMRTYYYSVTADDDVYISAETQGIERYTVTFPQYVSVKRYRPRTGETINCVSGDGIAEGDELTVKADYRDGYRLDSLTLNGSEIPGGYTYTVKNSDVTINAEFTLVHDKDHVIYIRSSEVKVTMDGKQLETGDPVKRGDVIRIDLIIPDGKSSLQRVLKINGVRVTILGRDAFTYYYTIGDEDPEITTEETGTYVPVKKQTVRFSYPVSVKRYDRDLGRYVDIPSGTQIYPGDILIISYNDTAGYRVTNLRLNGISIDPGYTYTVGDEDAVITADAYRNGCAVTFPKNVIVMRNGTSVPSGVYLNPGDRIFISAENRSGYITVITVNGVRTENGSYYTVGYEDLVINVSYVKNNNGSDEGGGSPNDDGKGGGNPTDDGEGGSSPGDDGGEGGSSPNDDGKGGGSPNDGGENNNNNNNNNNFNPGNPNANPMTPNVTPGNPNANPIYPNVTPGNPNANPGNPNVNPGNPNANPGNPNVNPGNPNANPADPGVVFVPVVPAETPPPPEIVHINPDPSIIPFIIITGAFDPDDISATAGAADNPVSDTALPVTNGVGMPMLMPLDLPARKKKRYRVLRRRKLSDTIFVC